MSHLDVLVFLLSLLYSYIIVQHNLFEASLFYNGKNVVDLIRQEVEREI